MFGRLLVQLQRRVHKNKQRLDSSPRKKRQQTNKNTTHGKNTQFEKEREVNYETHSSPCGDFLFLDKQHSNLSNLIKWSLKKNQYRTESPVHTIRFLQKMLPIASSSIRFTKVLHLCFSVLPILP